MPTTAWFCTSSNKTQIDCFIQNPIQTSKPLLWTKTRRPPPRLVIISLSLSPHVITPSSRGAVEVVSRYYPPRAHISRCPGSRHSNSIICSYRIPRRLRQMSAVTLVQGREGGATRGGWYPSARQNGSARLWTRAIAKPKAPTTQYLHITRLSRKRPNK